VKVLGKTWGALRGGTQWRENVLRYAAYLEYVHRLEAGESMLKIGYGASVPAMVDAVTDPRDRAALLARDLLGDYGASATPVRKSGASSSRSGRGWRSTPSATGG
jgi:hypothetical protein